MTSAKLGGVHLNYGFTWDFAAGVAPVQKHFVMSTARAEAIFKRGHKQIAGKSIRRTRTRGEQNQTGPLELTIHADGFAPLKVSGLYALEVHGVDDHLSSVLVADARWLLTRKHILREYNVRRRTGRTHYVQDAPVQVNRAIADFTYKRVTLNNGARWKAKEVLEDVLKELVGPSFRIEGNLPLSVDVESLVIDDTGPAALGRVLALMPGADVYVDHNGILVVFNSLDQSEGGIVAKIKGGPGPEDPRSKRYRGANIRLVDKSLIRPREFGCFFEQEIELRFDYTELADSSTTRVRQVPGKETRDIENVLPVVHPKVTLNGEEYARGSWLQVDDWITATQAQLVTDGDVVLGKDGNPTYPLSHELFREHAPTGFRIPRSVIAKYLIGTQAPVLDQLWNTIQTHWRKTYRVTSRYMDKLKSIGAYRVSIADQETGTRGRAEAFADYVVRPSRRGLVKQSAGNNQAAYNKSSYAVLLADASVAPVEVSIIDPEVGIFHLDFVIDPYGEGVTIMPGNLDEDIPKYDLTSGGIETAYVHWNTKLVKLTGTYKVAVVLTVARAAPTDVSRYHLEIVTPAQAASVLPVSAVGPSLGPDWAFKIGAGIETARFAWADADAAKIDEAIWDGLKHPSDPINPEHLRNVAKARAGMVYALLLDRHEGTMSTGLDPSIMPAGSCRLVSHSLTRAGVARTTVLMPPVTIPPDIWALMPESTRKVLQRQVQP